MTISIFVVCEADADFRTSSQLADRVLCDEIDWITQDSLQHHRRYEGRSKSVSFFTWTEVGKLARENNVRAHGFINGEKARPDAQQARRILGFLEINYESVASVLLIRDSDNDLTRWDGLEQARRNSPLGDRTIIGFAHTKRECWVLAGFQPSNQSETKLLDQMTRELGLDPTVKAEQLTAKHDHDKRSAKRVLALLTGQDPDRESRCWRDAELALLCNRGENSGLNNFLTEIPERLAPLFRQQRPQTREAQI